MDVICECPHKWVGRVRGKASLWLGKGARVVELLLSQLADISKAAYPIPLLANLKLVAMSSTSPSYVGHSIEAVTWAGMGDIHLVFRDRGVG